MPATEHGAPRQSLALANSLKWLTPEIDASLQRVRVLIDRQEADEGELEATAIVNELKLVCGALSMAGCHGGAILAEELLAAIELTAGGPPLAEPAAALAAVSGATLQLSDYLDALCHGSTDCAAVLQPAIGELRLACKRAAVTEADLFVWQMQRLAPQLPPPPPAEANAASIIAGKLLAPFQALLLQWLKGVEVQGTLVKLRKIGDHISSNAAHPDTVLLWTAFAAAIDSLIAEPGSESLELKRWVGRLGPHIKTLAEQGEEAAASSVGEMAWRLLAHAAVIHCDGSRWQLLRQQLPLDGALPVQSVLAAARQRLRGPNTRLLEKVGEEVRADLTLVKDGLDLALRAGGLAPATQASIRDRLIRIANTLLLLGLPQLEQVLRNQVGELAALGDSQTAPEGQWMRVATALLRVEHSLESALFRPVRQTRDTLREPAGELSETTPHGQDLRESVAALLREMLVDLARLKAQLDAYLKGGTLRDVFEPEQLLAEVTSGLVILDNPAAAMLSTRLRDWLASGTPAALRDDPALAVRFAEAIAALEIYLEALRDALPQPGRVLETL
jgi:chemosensory pili system protein ChpA (sensor histidine kinase/response regulator)